MTSADRLVGRHAELDLLRRRLADARAGSGRLVLVSGPAGFTLYETTHEDGETFRDFAARTPAEWWSERLEPDPVEA